MRKIKPLRDRLLARYTVDPATGCWLWNGAKNNKGYGQIRGGRTGSKLWLTHVVSYREFIGNVPDGLELDHLCRTPACLNPLHLEAVTHAENVRRSDGPRKGGEATAAIGRAMTHCLRGHEFNPVNTLTVDGRRWCRLCKRIRQRQYYKERVTVTSAEATP